MPDTITDQERAAIDAAVGEGRVTHVPRGVSGEFDALVYDTATKSITLKDPKAREAARRLSYGKPGSGRKKDPAVMERRRKARELAESGMSAQEIADALNVGVGTIHHDANILKFRIKRKMSGARS